MTELLLGDEIVGRGLILRRPRWPDADEVIAICREQDISIFTRVPPDYQREDFEKFLVTVEKTFLDRSGGEYLIRESVDGPVLGAVGIRAKDGYAEAGYYVGSRARGNGVATRALELVCDLAFEQGQRRITLEIRIENDASIRVGERAGFTQCDTIYGTPADGCGVDEDTIDVKIFERLGLIS